MYSSNVEISGNTTFRGNSASVGGGVYASQNSNVYMRGTLLSEVIQLVLVEESMRHKIVMCTSGEHYFSGNSAIVGIWWMS